MSSSAADHSSRLSLNRLLAKTKSWRNRRRDAQTSCGSDHSDGGGAKEASSNGSASSGSPFWGAEAGDYGYYGRNGGDDSPASRSALTPSWSFRQPAMIANGSDGQLMDDLFKLLNDPSPAVREKALSTIFHLARSSTTARDSILAAGGITAIVNEIQRNGAADAQVARALFHLCLGNPLPPIPLVTPAFPILQRILLTNDEEEVLVIVCFVIAELATPQDLNALNYINKFLPPPLHIRLLTLLVHDSIDVRFRTLIILAQLANADRIHGPKASKVQCSDWFNHHILSYLRRCLRIPELQDETILLIQCLMTNHFDRLIKSEDLIRKYFILVNARIGLESRLMTSLCSIMKNADAKQIRVLKEMGCEVMVAQTLEDIEKIQHCREDLRLLREQLSSSL